MRRRWGGKQEGRGGGGEGRAGEGQGRGGKQEGKGGAGEGRGGERRQLSKEKCDKRESDLVETQEERESVWTSAKVGDCALVYCGR